VSDQFELIRRRPEAARFFVDALARLRSRSCIIDGEAVACGDDERDRPALFYVHVLP
jgi:hypothetical protein